MVQQVLYRPLVSIKWLAEAVRANKIGPELRVLDASWYEPGQRDAEKEFRERHIPGASRFDIEECKDKTSPYEFMLPSENHFADYVGHLGISNDTHVVVYDGDNLGTFYAPRAWWMFRVFGHRTVSVLNGGFKNWVKEGHPVTSEITKPEKAVFKATLNKSLLKTYEEMIENLESKRFQMVDSRSEGRFRGTEPEPGSAGLQTPKLDIFRLLPFPHSLLSSLSQKKSHRPSRVCRNIVQQVFYRPLVSIKWLAEAVRANKIGPALCVLDTSWYEPSQTDAQKEFREWHIPGASFFDLDECKDKTLPYELMLPSENHFADHSENHFVGHLGISNDTHVVVYDGDNLGSLYAPRTWWMFRVFGHQTVSVLNGGFKNWVKEGHPVTSEITKPEKAVFKATLNKSLLKTYEEMIENLESKRFQMVDSRVEGKFRGTEPEPGIPGLEPGHIPGSKNMPFVNFLTEEGFEKSTEEIRNMFQEKKVDLSKPLIATCRKGVTACHIALAAYLCGKPDVAVYDGSWSEWFRRAPTEYKISEWNRHKA